MRADSVSRVGAKVIKSTLDKENLNMFVKLMNRRDIRKGVVNKLVRVLEDGEHFETPFMTNLKDGKHRLLDGNHRIVAVETYLNKYPNRKVEAHIHYYENLNEEEERKKYTTWNLGTKQNTNDFVKQYWHTIPIVKRLEKDNTFPCKISHAWGSNVVEFKLLVGAYIAAKDKVFQGGFGGSAIEFIEKSKQLGESVDHTIKAFMKDYIEVFGVPDKKNMHYKKVIFNSMFRIWIDNAPKVGYSTMRSAMHKVRGHHMVIHYTSLGSTRDIVIQCRIGLLNVINGQRKKNLFV